MGEKINVGGIIIMGMIMIMDMDMGIIRTPGFVMPLLLRTTKMQGLGGGERIREGLISVRKRKDEGGGMRMRGYRRDEMRDEECFESDVGRVLINLRLATIDNFVCIAVLSTVYMYIAYIRRRPSLALKSCLLPLTSYLLPLPSIYLMSQNFPISLCPLFHSFFFFLKKIFFGTFLSFLTSFVGIR